jgi:hypothetical protein
MYIVGFGGPGRFHIVCVTLCAEEAVLRAPWGSNIYRCEDGIARLCPARAI